jgi:hypothetical protein
MTGAQRKQHRSSRARSRRVIAYGTRREQIDTHKLARALMALAQAKLEAEARAEHQRVDQEDDGEVDDAE